MLKNQKRFLKNNKRNNTSGVSRYHCSFDKFSSSKYKCRGLFRMLQFRNNKNVGANCVCPKCKENLNEFNKRNRHSNI